MGILLLKVFCIIGALLLTAFVVKMRLLKGEDLNSLSETAYITHEPRQFTMVMCMAAYLIAPAFVAKTSGWLGLVCMGLFAGLMMVGLSPYYRRHERTLHYVGAFLAALSSQFVIAVKEPVLLLAWLGYVAYLIANARRSVFFEEAVCFFTIIVYCLKN